MRALYYEIYLVVPFELIRIGDLTRNAAREKEEPPVISL